MLGFLCACGHQPPVLELEPSLKRRPQSSTEKSEKECVVFQRASVPFKGITFTLNFWPLFFLFIKIEIFF